MPAPAPIEQPDGDPLIPPVDPEAVDAHRKRAYLSYETFLRDNLKALDADRPARWARDYGSVEAYRASVEPMRRRFADVLGFWCEPSQRGAVNVIEEAPLAEDDTFVATRLVYEVRPGLTTYAIRLRPSKPNGLGLIAQHGYLATPEMACGLTATANRKDYTYRSMGIRAARRGYHVIAPFHPSGYGTTGDTIDQPLPDHPKQTVHYGKNRLHRLCQLAGGTLLGLDMLATSRAVDLLLGESQRVGLYGLSRGGQTALYLPALDTRIEATVCAAYFNTRLAKLIGPYPSANYVDWFGEGQILPGVVSDFADSDLVSLIAPRAFAVEAGRGDTSVDQRAAWDEFARAKEHYTKLGLDDRIAFIAHDEGHVSATVAAMDFLDTHLRG